MHLKKMVYYGMGPIGSAILSLLVVPLTAWIFAPEDVARLNIFQITVSFSILLTVLGLDQAYVREYQDAIDKIRLLKACIFPGLALLLCIAVSSFYFSGSLSNLLYGVAAPELYWVTLCAFFVSYLSRFFSLVLRMEERPVSLAVTQVIPKAIQLGLIGSMAAAPFHKDFSYLLIATFLSLLSAIPIFLLTLRLDLSEVLKKELRGPELKNLLQFGFPLAFAGLAYWILTATSSIALRSLSNLSELAIYSVAASFAGAAAVFQTIFSIIWAPTVYRWVKEGVGTERINHVMYQILAFACIILITCGSLAWLTDLVLPAEYHSVKYLLLCTVLQPILYTLSEVTCVGIAITRRTIFSLWSTLAALIVNVGLSCLLVPPHGAKGAAVSNAISFLVFFLARTEFSSWIWRSIPRQRLYVIVCSAVALSVFTTLEGENLPFHFSIIWLLSLPLTIVLIRPQLRQLMGILQIRRPAG